MSGILKGDTVVIKDKGEASTLYNRGNYGYPLSGGGSELDLIEATYLLECGRLEIEKGKHGMTFEAMFNYASGRCQDFDIQYIAYRDMRQRGFVVKNESGYFDMAVFPRGKTLSNSRPQYYLVAVSERASSGIDIFKECLEETYSKGKQLLYCVVDEEADPTYYVMSRREPKGKIEVMPSGTIMGKMVRDRVFVFDSDSCMELRSGGFYGKMIDNVLQLSLVEACSLMEHGILQVTDYEDREVQHDDIIKFGRDTQDDFDLRMTTYRDLRERGLVVKTGFKYGTHFRVYEESPDDCHAKFLVHSVSGDNVTMWPEISRAVRLSGGVKKEILFARITEGVEYFEFKWFRP